MNILFDIAHPASVHFFKNLIKQLKKDGHTVIVLARNKDITFTLLETYNIDYIKLGKHYKSILGKLFGAFFHIVKMLNYGIKYKIDIFVDAGTIYPAPVSYLLRKTNIIIDNTDVDFTLEATKIFKPIYITNASFHRKLSEKQIFIESFNELSFLHPSCFSPNSEVLKNLGLLETQKLIILRFVLWKSVDDIGFQGFNIAEIRNMVKEFSKYGRVLISSEYDLPDDLRSLRIEKHPNIKFGQMQDLEYYATLLFGESGAMAAESAMLGTPSFFISPKKLGFIKELSEKYQLIYHYETKDGAVEKAISLLKDDDLNEKVRLKHEKLLSDKIAYTTFLSWFIQNYPGSYSIMKTNPNYQFNFK